MKTKEKWTINQVITTVLMSVILIVIQVVVSMICMMNHFVSMVLSVGFIVLLCAPVYFLMLYKVRKRGVSMIYMTMIGIVYLMMSNWYLLPYYIGVGLLCEWILGEPDSSDYPKKMTLAWTSASLLYNGTNLLPIWFFWDTYYEFAVSSGMNTEYIEAYRQYYTSPGWVIFIVLFTTICGLLGSMIAKKLMKKHFEKAGVL